MVDQIHHAVLSGEDNRSVFGDQGARRRLRAAKVVVNADADKVCFEADGFRNAGNNGIYALSGIVEADWAPYRFSMNWLFTRANTPVRFERGEPFCHVFPVRRGLLEKVTPALHLISEDPALQEAPRPLAIHAQGIQFGFKSHGVAGAGGEVAATLPSWLKSRWQAGSHQTSPHAPSAQASCQVNGI